MLLLFLLLMMMIVRGGEGCKLYVLARRTRQSKMRRMVVIYTMWKGRAQPGLCMYGKRDVAPKGSKGVARRHG